VQLCELEVVWPLHRWHYLSPALADEGLVMHTEQAATDDPTMASVDVLSGRDLGPVRCSPAPTVHARALVRCSA